MQRPETKFLMQVSTIEVVLIEAAVENLDE